VANLTEPPRPASADRYFVANPTEPSRAASAGEGAADSARNGAPPAVTTGDHPLRMAALLFAAALALCLSGYLALSVPASWFPAAVPKEWSARELQLTRGEGSLVGNEWVITALDATGIAIVSLNTDLRSGDYRAIAWIGADFPETVDAYGHLLPEILGKNPNWAGRIGGIALSIRGSLSQPVRIRGVAAKPMGAVELLRDRSGEWRTFEAWTGTSINTLAGGADVQDLPLPALLAATIVLAALAWYALAWRRGFVAALPAAIAALFVAGWLLLDFRWAANLGWQARATAAQYAGKDWRERRLAAEDGPLFSFIEKVRAKMSEREARVFMVADADYFRGRGAYHLYPHNVFFEPYLNRMPSPSALRTGDYLVVYQRRGVQYNAAENKLRWDGGAPVSAEALVVEPGAALFRIR